MRTRSRTRRPVRLLAALSVLALPGQSQTPAPLPPAQGVQLRPPGQDASLPGRVLFQVRPDELEFSLLDRSWRGLEPRPGSVSGIASVDAVLGSAGSTGIRRTLIDVKDTDRGRALGLERWFTAHVDPGVDVEELAQRLAVLPQVEAASPDWLGMPAQVPNDPLYPDNWGHDNVGQLWASFGTPVGTPGFDADAAWAWDGPAGYGTPDVVVAVIDTGVDLDHPDLRLVPGWDYGADDSDPDDEMVLPE